MNRTNLSLSISYAIHKNREAWQEQQLSLKIDEALEKVRTKATDVPTGNFVNDDTEFEVKHHDDFEGDSLTYKVDPETGESTLIGADDKFYINIPDTVEDPVVGENEPPKLEKRKLGKVEEKSTTKRPRGFNPGILNKDMYLFVHESYLGSERLGPVMAAINDMYRREVVKDISLKLEHPVTLDSRGIVFSGEVIHENFSLNFIIKKAGVGEDHPKNYRGLGRMTGLLLPDFETFNFLFDSDGIPFLTSGTDRIYVDEYPRVCCMSPYAGGIIDEVVTKEFPLGGRLKAFFRRVRKWLVTH